MEDIERMKASIKMDLAMKAAASEEAATRDMLLGHLAEAASRMTDIADIIDRDGSYKDAGFLRASADRCRAAISVATNSDAPLLSI